MVAIERNSGVCVHYAGAPRPNAAAVGPREYKLARLPGLVVAGRIDQGFSVKGFQVPPDATIMAFFGERLAPVIGQWSEAEQTRAIHNLLAFAEDKKLYIYGSFRGIQTALNDLMYGLTQVKIAFDTRQVFPLDRHSDLTMDLGVDMEFRSLDGAISGGIRIDQGIAHMDQVTYGLSLPAKDLEAILRFQGE
jgi:hypothetical protein